jgi:hypothetical protein
MASPPTIRRSRHADPTTTIEEREMPDTREALIAAVQANFETVKREIWPRLDASPDPAFANPELRHIQVAQNVLRTCLEAALQKMLPYTHQTSVELAIRLASYSLSIVPMEDQDYVMAGFMQTFPLAHEKRMAGGVRISTNWQFEDGRSQPNFPDNDG